MGGYGKRDLKVTALIAGVLREQAQVVDGNAVALRNMDDGDELADIHAEVARRLTQLAGLVGAGLLGVLDFHAVQASAEARPDAEQSARLVHRQWEIDEDIVRHVLGQRASEDEIAAEWGIDDERHPDLAAFVVDGFVTKSEAAVRDASRSAGYTALAGEGVIGAFTARADAYAALGTNYADEGRRSGAVRPAVFDAETEACLAEIRAAKTITVDDGQAAGLAEPGQENQR